MNFTALNCTACRFELSQCLDGRLASGRRAEVMNHAESCATCGSFWLELQAAQRLTLSLREAEVSHNFRDGLWTRIHTGEGTPSAVFTEQVPLWSKVRYTLTGAAAAAALLIGVSFLTKDEPLSDSTINKHATNVAAVDQNIVDQNIVDQNTGDGTEAELLANSNVQPSQLHGTLETRQSNQYRGNQYQLASPPLMSSAKRLSMEVVAVETARQLEERYATATFGMRMMQIPGNRESAINKVLESAHEMRDFGELLLDLRDRQHLFFTDAGIDADLQFAVKMLTLAGTIAAPTAQTIETFVAPVLSSGRLAHVSGAISLKPSNDRQEQMDLWRVNTMRPELMAKMFITLSNPEQMRPGTVFLLEGDCDVGWVAPISEIHANTRRIQWQQHR